VQDGAKEIDIVITRSHVLTGNYEALYSEVRDMREACGESHLKAILATGNLSSYEQVYKASLVCMMAGADFIKTSTGMEGTNATLPVGLVMCRAIREYHDRTGYMVGFKPAGGIRTGKDALTWLMLIKEELGVAWLSNEYFRIGASSLLTDIERQLHHQATGQYASANHMSMS
jgi:deoxyribose-phosphate aldolase